MLGIAGTVAGTLLSLVAIFGINVWKPTFDFGQQQNLVMAPTSLSVSSVNQLNVINP